MFTVRRILFTPNRIVRSLAQNTRTNEFTFGFENVTKEEKDRRVYEVFHNVASSYDVMNDAMSFGIHRLWKDIFVERMGPTPGTKLIDVAGGTGDIAFRVIKYLNNNKGLNEESLITVYDINAEMLKVGEQRAIQKGYSNIQWVQGNAEDLPFEDNTYTVYTIAFGIRNVTRIEEALKEARRVLKPGGRFLCLEFSQVDNELARRLYDAYSFQVIPAMGQIIASDWKSYQYLVESIRKFPPQEEFKSLIEKAGFYNVTYENLMLGVVCIHSGFKL